jgi:hypothetical protein
MFSASYANFLSNPRRIHSGKKDRGWDKEKGSERGIWMLCAVVCCAQPPLPPHHLSPILRANSPALGYRYLGQRYWKEPFPWDTSLLNNLRLQRQISRIASLQEDTSMLADIGQQ